MNLRKISALFLATLICNGGAIHAEDVLISQQQRDLQVKRAEVWSTPAWYDSNLNFVSEKYNLFENLVRTEKEKKISGNRLLCVYDEKLQRAARRSSTGKTEKIYCYLGEVYKPTDRRDNNQIRPVVDALGKMTEVKVKYQTYKGSNKEIYAELAGTRLLSALGFAADKVFFVPQLYCQNCSETPWNMPEAEPGVVRLFESNITESKFKGEKIQSESDYGWVPKDLKILLSDEPSIAEIQKKHRDALLLLSAIIQHVDNKASNHRLVCTEKPDESGNCPETAQVIALVHDLGATFGDGGMKLGFISGSSKMNLKGWARTPVWRDPYKCIANQHSSRTNDETELFPKISESGRAHLARLLSEFSKGSEGRLRVEQIFKEAQVHEIETSAKDWADALMKKISAVINPPCETDPSQCGKTFNGCSE